MSPPDIRTRRLRLVFETRESTLAFVAGMDEATRAQVSPAWLRLVQDSSECDPWIHGFAIVLGSSGETVGKCGFKGPPDASGTVEIAYGIDPQHQGLGYATEAAAALLVFACAQPGVRRILAHTLDARNASTTVLTRCGFRGLGQVVDPEDGPVWRWEWVPTGERPVGA